MARSIRPRTLAVAFGVYFLLIAYFAWTFSNGLTSAWFLADSTRWIYTTYLIVAAIFLVGLGGLGLSVRRSLDRKIRELDARLRRGSAEPVSDALPPPLIETPIVTATRDHVDRDIDELLESLSEVEATAAQQAHAMGVESEGAPAAQFEDRAAREIAERRDRLKERKRRLGVFVVGPGVAAALILGISGMMLPGSEGFAQSQAGYTLNTALILGISYGWIGVGGYVVATIAALVSSKDDRVPK